MTRDDQAVPLPPDAEVRRAYEAGRAQGAATEREACAKLAEQHRVVYARYQGCVVYNAQPFADLLRARTTP